MIVVEAIYGSHHARAVTPTGAVHVELAGRWVVHDFQELSNLGVARILFVNNRDVHVAHALGFDVAFFLRRVVRQINDGANA